MQKSRYLRADPAKLLLEEPLALEELPHHGLPAGQVPVLGAEHIRYRARHRGEGSWVQPHTPTRCHPARGGSGQTKGKEPKAVRSRGWAAALRASGWSTATKRFGRGMVFLQGQTPRTGAHHRPDRAAKSLLCPVPEPGPRGMAREGLGELPTLLTISTQVPPTGMNRLFAT